MVERVEHVMGMPVRVDVRDAGAGPAACDAVFAWLRFVDATFSTYDPRSEISRIGRGALAAADAHPLVREVLDRCEALRAETGGAFDVRAPIAGALDPTGLVKGWAVERAAALLEAAGARRFLVDAGGDVVVRGGPWRVGIRHPRRRDRLAAVLDARATAPSRRPAPTSAAPHIVDPRTGRPAARRALGDRRRAGPRARPTRTPPRRSRWARAARRGPPALAGYDAMTIVPGDRVLSTPGFLRRCPGGTAARSLEPA